VLNLTSKPPGLALTLRVNKDEQSTATINHKLAANKIVSFVQ